MVIYIISFYTIHTCMNRLCKDTSDSATSRSVNIQLNRTMYYDYELKITTGFYPQINKPTDCVYRNTIIEFILFDYTEKVLGWRQMSGPVIFGFTKKNGIELLNSLNSEANIEAHIIMNCGGRTIFPMNYNATYYILENYSK